MPGAILVRHPLLLASLACIACGASPATDLATIDTLPGGIERVVNHGAQEWADTNGWKLVLERTIQPGEGEPGELGIPSGIALHPSGGVVVRDNRPSQLVHHRADGTVSPISREGDGPDEYRDPAIAFVGDTLIVQDQKRSRATLYSLDGVMFREFPTNCCHGGAGIPIDGEGTFRVAGNLRVEGVPFTRSWIRFDLSGTRLEEIPVPKREANNLWTITTTSAGGIAQSWHQIPFAGSANEAVLWSGEIAYGTGDINEFLVTRSGTDTTRIFGRDDLVARPVPAHVRDSAWVARTSGNADLKEVASKSDIPASYPFWRQLFVDGSNNVWVLSDDGLDVPERFDVYTEGGILRGAVASPVGTSNYPQFSWAGDRLAILDQDDLDLPRIRVYRIER